MREFSISRAQPNVRVTSKLKNLLIKQVTKVDSNESYGKFNYCLVRVVRLKSRSKSCEVSDKLLRRSVGKVCETEYVQFHCCYLPVGEKYGTQP